MKYSKLTLRLIAALIVAEVILLDGPLIERAAALIEKTVTRKPATKKPSPDSTFPVNQGLFEGEK